MQKLFKYEGFEGNNPKNGTIEADNEQKAVELLSRQGIIAISMEEIERPADESEEAESDTGDVYKAKKIKNKDKVIFTKKFTSMVRAGLPILKTLRMLEDQTEHKHLKVVAKQIRKTVEGGTTLSEAFGEHPDVFDQVYVNMMKAGESSGKLTTFLEKLVIHLEKIERIKKKIKGALMYPCILLTVAVGVITLMLVKVVPVFQSMFAASGNDLPGPTKLIVSISEFVRSSGGLVLVLTIVGIFIGLKKLYKKSPKFKQQFDTKILKVPIFGQIIAKSTLANIAMVSSNLSAAGVSVIESMNIIGRTLKNVVFLQALEKIKSGVAEGKQLSKLYSQQEVFPPAFWQMVAVGEETGRVDDMLNSVALYYEEEFDGVVDKLTELLEPIMIVFMGATVGFIIIAMYMPIFQMGKAVGG